MRTSEKKILKEQLFCQEYIIDYNGTRAYGAAYGEEDKGRCNSNARNLLKRKDIQDYIKELQTERNKRLQITQDDVMRELAAVAFSNVCDYAEIGKDGKLKYIPTSEIDPSKQAAIMSIRQDKYGMTIRLHDKLKALEAYAKMAGYLIDKQEITATVTYEQFLSKQDGDYNYD